MEKPTVVIADGLKLVREATRQVLEQSNRVVVLGEAGDGEEAVRLTKELNPDVALLDIALRGLNGLEAIRQIKRACPRTTVVVLLEDERDVYIRAVLEVGAATFVNKTGGTRELIQRILDVRTGEPVLDGSIALRVLRDFVPSRGPGRISVKEPGLNDSERRTLALAAGGMPNRAIARTLHCSKRDVSAALGQVFEKLEVASRTEAIVAGLRQGLLCWPDVSDGKTAPR